MPPTTTVRVTQATRERLARLSARSGKTTADLLEDLTARAEDDAMLDEFNAHFGDRDAAAEYHESETRAVEGTLADGLKELE